MDNINYNNNFDENNSFSNNNMEANMNAEAGIDAGTAQKEAMASASASYDGNSNGYSAASKKPPFYTERHVASKSKKSNSLFQLILVAVLSAIFGGCVVGGILGFVIPVVSPTVGSYIDKLIPGNGNIFGSEGSDAEVRKVEIITQSDSVVSAVAKKVSSSVVGIRAVPATSTARDFASFLYGYSSSVSPSEGSGIIISSDGYIVTNNHVIERALDSSGQLAKGAKIEVYLTPENGKELDKDKAYEAKLIGWDRKTDLAVLKIEGNNFPAAEFGDSDNLEVGELAIAIGNPGGLEYMGSVTVGVISGLNRKVQTEDGKEMRYIQTDAAINPGNSGGALVNSQGKIIGINTIKVSGNGYEGLGFAIPSNTALEIVNSLKTGTYIKGRDPVLGIQASTQYNETIAKRYGWPAGVYVISVTQFSGAYIAGIRENDIITKFEGKEVKNLNELNEIKNKYKPGDTVEVEVYRIQDKEYLTFKVTLSEDRG